MRGSHIYFWEPTVSPHKLGLFDHVSNHPAVESAWYIAQRDMSAARREEGWSVSDVAHRNLIIAPSRDRVREVMASSPPHAIHVFSGVHWVPSIVEGLKAAMETGRRFGLMREPRGGEGVRGWLRLAHSWLTEETLRRRADFLLAIGRNGPPWFRAAGYREEAIFPFAYFLTERADSKRRIAGALHDRGARKPKVSFLGRIEVSKGIRLFLEATRLVKHPITIAVAGTGSKADLLRDLARRSDAPLTYHGPIPMETVPDFLADTDILVLPSIVKDGWGAVVSEALMAGAAVVATDRVGASVCIASDERGRVLQDLTPQSLADAIDWLIANDRLSAHYRGRRAAWARSCLTSAVGADYLLAILAHVYQGEQRPSPFYAPEMAVAIGHEERISCLS